jgi:tetratricopeptide (TPR) repeat protein
MVNTSTDNNTSTQGFLLRMGNAWLEQGELRQAIGVFLKVVEEYPGGDESNVAKSALLDIAQRYEKEGQLRLSLDILERLDDAVN